MKYKCLSWSVGFFSPDTDYADYTEDSAFGRAATNGRGNTDKNRISPPQFNNLQQYFLKSVFFGCWSFYIICVAATIGSGSTEGRICGIICVIAGCFSALSRAGRMREALASKLKHGSAVRSACGLCLGRENPLRDTPNCHLKSKQTSHKTSKDLQNP